MPHIPNPDPNLLTIRSLSFSDLLQMFQASVRLRNCFSRKIEEGSFPFQTIGDYLDAGESGVTHLMKIPNFGKKTARELNELIAEAIVSRTALSTNKNPLDRGINACINNQSTRLLSFPVFLDQCHASVRLQNGIIKGISEGRFPYESVGEYLDDGKQAFKRLMSIPNIGKGASQELQALLENVRGKRLELADQLEAQYPQIFDDLLTRYRQTPDSEPLGYHQFERQIEHLLSTPRDAEVCLRRYQGDTLEAIATDLGVTRERVRQIEKKYDSIVTKIYTKDWTTQAIAFLQAQQDVPGRLPCNEALSKHHHNLPAALRHVFLPESERHGLLHPQERYQLAMKLGVDADAELKESKQWTLERLLYEVKAFAAEIGRPEFMPKQKELESHGRNNLRGAIGRFGGQSKVAALAGLIYQGQQVAEDGSRTYWTKERIGDFLHEVVEKEGRPGVMPTQTECRKYAPNPNTIITILTQGGSYGKDKTWYEIAKHYGLKYSRDTHRVTLKFVRAFVESLGDALHSLTPSEVYVLFEQQGIAKTGKNTNRDRSFDNFVTAMQSGYLPREEIERWVKGEKGELIEALFDPDIESVEDAFASVGRHIQRSDHKIKQDNPNDELYREDVEQHLPSPRAIDTLTSLEKATDILVQTSSDAEAVQFLVAKAAGKLWRRCFEDEEAALEEAHQHHGNTYSESARDSFLEEYTRSKQLPLPQGYSFKDVDGVIRAPKLMQLLIAYKVFKDGRVLNLSGTGTGKTLSAILASRVIGARVTVISCPNATVAGWSRTILNAFPESDVCEKTWHPVWSDKAMPRYLILNHEAFQNRNEGHLKHFIESNMIDFVVIDELHQVKQRDEGFESQRRRLLNGLITDVPGNRPKPRVLGMSATPIINNLQEGKSLIELVSSLEHNDVDTAINVQNCMKLYQKFTTMGFRMMPKYRTDRAPQIHPVDCTPYIQNLLELGHKPHPQQVEAVLVRARWPIIKRYLKPKTVVFTDYVKDIIPYLVEVIRQTGLTVGVYTGDEKLATEIGYTDMLDQFMRGELDVLLASIKTVGTGIDGLQFVCNNVIFATLPWTATDYEQAVGRFDREGFKFGTLDIHIPKTYSVLGDGQEWSWCEAKLGRIENKRDIARAAVDGEIPDTSSQLTPEKATNYWMGWLKRIVEEGLSEIERREIRVPLDESDQSESKRRFSAYGDFSHLNARWNNSHSTTTHKRLQNNSEEWCYYHTRLQEQERLWQHVPREECIKHLTENLPRGSVIGDFGCGQAQLAQALRDIHTVYSMDHVAINHSVIACDMSRSPLDDAILDAAVFSLSLMGENNRDYIVEAYRTLKPGGQLLIYHPSAGNDIQKFVRGLESFGFSSVQHGTVYKWHFIWAIKRGRQKDSSVEIGF